jgi:hypothetical protein
MGEGSASAAVWHAVASCDEAVGRWTLRVSMTTDTDGGAREDRHPPTIDAACELLRLWYGNVTRTER